MSKDQVKGRDKEAKGKVKEDASNLVDHQNLERHGVDQHASGKVQADAGDRKHTVKKASGRKH